MEIIDHDDAVFVSMLMSSKYLVAQELFNFKKNIKSPTYNTSGDYENFSEKLKSSALSSTMTKLTNINKDKQLDLAKQILLWLVSPQPMMSYNDKKITLMECISIFQEQSHLQSMLFTVGDASNLAVSDMSTPEKLFAHLNRVLLHNHTVVKELHQKNKFQKLDFHLSDKNKQNKNE